MLELNESIKITFWNNKNGASLVDDLLIKSEFKHSIPISYWKLLSLLTNNAAK